MEHNKHYNNKENFISSNSKYKKSNDVTDYLNNLNNSSKKQSKIDNIYVKENNNEEFNDEGSYYNQINEEDKEEFIERDRNYALTTKLVDEDKFNILEKTDNFKKIQFSENTRVISKLKKICLFCFVFMIIELIGGYVAGSLAIMTDAAHLLSDLSGFVISMLSLYIALRPANAKLSYGYHRAEILGALVSILIIWFLTAWLLTEAYGRFFNPRYIDSKVMMIIAGCGLLFNLIMAKILMNNDDIPNAFEDEENEMGSNLKQDKELDDYYKKEENKNNTKNIEENKDKNNNNNDVIIVNSEDITENNKQNIIQKDDDKANSAVLRATIIHIIGDIIQSVGVLTASIIIYFFQDNHPYIVKADPICTFIFGIIVLSTSIPIFKDCISVLMEATPKNINYDEMAKEFRNIPDIVDMHDIHIWSIKLGKVSLTAHFISNNPQKTLENATIICKKYGIYHSTIQVEDYTQRRRASFKLCNHINDNQIH